MNKGHLQAEISQIREGFVKVKVRYDTQFAHLKDNNDLWANNFHLNHLWKIILVCVIILFSSYFKRKCERFIFFGNEVGYVNEDKISKTVLYTVPCFVKIKKIIRDKNEESYF